MQLVVTIKGKAVSPDAIVAVGKDAKALVRLDGRPSDWPIDKLRLKLVRDGLGSEDLPLKEPGLEFDLPQVGFRKPQKVEVSLQDKNQESPILEVKFHVTAASNLWLRTLSILVIAVVVSYVTLAVPSILDSYEGMSRLGFGAITLGALFTAIRVRIFRALSTPLTAWVTVFLGVLATTVIVCRGSVLVNRTAEPIDLKEPQANLSTADRTDLGKESHGSSSSEKTGKEKRRWLEPGEWRIDLFAPKAPPTGYCDLNNPLNRKGPTDRNSTTPPNTQSASNDPTGQQQTGGNCRPFRDPVDVPFYAHFFRIQEYGCDVRSPAPDDAIAKAWKGSRQCRPQRLEWQTDSLETAVSHAPGGADTPKTPESQGSSGLGTTTHIRRTWTATCELATTRSQLQECKPPECRPPSCNPPEWQTSAILRDFVGKPANAPSPAEEFGFDLRFSGRGLLRESFVPGGSIAYNKIVLPLPEGASWVTADLEIDGRKIGQSLIFPSHADYDKDKPECWFLQAREHLAKLVLRGTHKGSPALAQFVATDPSILPRIPMCWSAAPETTLDTIEIYLDQYWNDRDNWTLSLPSKLAPRSVHIYTAQGYWGTVEPNRSKLKASDSKDNWFPVVLHQIALGRVPKLGTALDRLDAAADGSTWQSGLTKPEWFWTVGNDPPSPWKSRLRPDIYVERPQNEKTWQSIQHPGPCYFTESGQPISAARCKGKRTPDDFYKKFTRVACGSAIWCSGDAKDD